MTATTKLYTAEDLWEMPTDEPWELWDGELQRIPGAGGEASAIGGIICSYLGTFVRPARLGLVTTANGAYILARNPDTVLIPDAAFLPREQLPGGVVPEFFSPVPPALAVEVRSPTAVIDEARKRALYRRAGVPLLWWVAPEHRSVAVYRHGELIATLGEGDELDGEDGLPGFRLAVAEIFA